MSVRTRQRRTHAATDETAWLREREDLLRYWPGDLLADCERFWEREEDVPADLRPRSGGPSPFWHILASDTPHRGIEAERREQWEDLKVRRLAWLREQGYR